MRRPGRKGRCMSTVAICPEDVRLFAWDELAWLWNPGDFGGVHDCLGLRSRPRLVQTRARGTDDKDARFLQGLAFAALAFHFTKNRNQEGARLLADDALAVLPGYGTAHMGIEIGSVLKSLRALRPMLEGLDTEAVCPMQPLNPANSSIARRLDDRNRSISFDTPLGQEWRWVIRRAGLHA